MNSAETTEIVDEEGNFIKLESDEVNVLKLLFL